MKFDAYPAWFKLELNSDTQQINLEKSTYHTNDSFLIGFYQTLYVKMKKRLKVDLPVLDYNLKRLENCISRVALERGHPSTMLSLDELPLALEFFLQFDGQESPYRSILHLLSLSSGPVLLEDLLVQRCPAETVRKSIPRRSLLHRNTGTTI